SERPWRGVLPGQVCGGDAPLACRGGFATAGLAAQCTRPVADKNQLEIADTVHDRDCDGVALPFARSDGCLCRLYCQCGGKNLESLGWQWIGGPGIATAASRKTPAASPDKPTIYF